MSFNKFSLLLLISVFACAGNSNQPQEVVAIENSFGIDVANKLIVWHVENIDSLNANHKKITEFNFGEKYKCKNSAPKLSYSEPLVITKGGTDYTLYITKLPLVHITVNGEINDSSKVLSYLTYFENGKTLNSVTGIEHRGNLSLSYPKKTFDIEIWADSTSKQSKDMKFPGLRSDDDWILDGLYNEPLKIRSTLSSKLWLNIYKPSYQSEEPEAKSGVKTKFVEVFKNNSYQGVFALSEQIDRKLLKLKKAEGQNVLGELFKASSYEGAPAFEKAPEYDNVFPHWGGYEMRYPFINSKSHWDDLAELINLVVTDNEEDFKSRIAQQLDLENAIDYFLLVNILRATDNLGKNYFIARYDQNTPYFKVPWDLDGVLGTIQDGKRIATTNDILSNGLYDRLLESNPDDYRNRLKSRWDELRKKEFSNKSLFGEIDMIYNQFSKNKVYEREEKIWPAKKTKEDHYKYLTSWLNDRLEYLDTYFDSL